MYKVSCKNESLGEIEDYYIKRMAFAIVWFNSNADMLLLFFRINEKRSVWAIPRKLKSYVQTFPAFQHSAKKTYSVTIFWIWGEQNLLLVRTSFLSMFEVSWANFLFGINRTPERNWAVWPTSAMYYIAVDISSTAWYIYIYIYILENKACQRRALNINNNL